MSFYLPPKDLNQLLMGYLRDMGYYESLSALQLESNVGEGEMDEELLYLQKLTLQGRWEDAIKYLQPLRKVMLHNFDMIEHKIRKQQYLEALSWVGVGGQRYALVPWKPKKKTSGLSETALRESKEMVTRGSVSMMDEELDMDMQVITTMLKEMEDHCSKAEFSSLCNLLTLENLSDDPKYRTWTVAQGRLECFQAMRTVLWKVLPGRNGEDNNEDKRKRAKGFMQICSMALEYQQARHMGILNEVPSLTKSVAEIEVKTASYSQNSLFLNEVEPADMLENLSLSTVDLNQANAYANKVKYDKRHYIEKFEDPLQEEEQVVMKDIKNPADKVVVQVSGDWAKGGTQENLVDVDTAQPHVIMDSTHGIEIHVPKSVKKDVLSPARRSQDFLPFRDEVLHKLTVSKDGSINSEIPSGSSVISNNTGLSRIPLPAPLSNKKPLSWTVEIGTETKENDDGEDGHKDHPHHDTEHHNAHGSPDHHTSKGDYHFVEAGHGPDDASYASSQKSSRSQHTKTSSVSDSNNNNNKPGHHEGIKHLKGKSSPPRQTREKKTKSDAPSSMEKRSIGQTASTFSAAKRREKEEREGISKDLNKAYSTYSQPVPSGYQGPHGGVMDATLPTSMGGPPPLPEEIDAASVKSVTSIGQRLGITHVPLATSNVTEGGYTRKFNDKKDTGSTKGKNKVFDDMSTIAGTVAGEETVYSTATTRVSFSDDTRSQATGVVTEGHGEVAPKGGWPLGNQATSSLKTVLKNPDAANPLIGLHEGSSDSVNNYSNWVKGATRHFNPSYHIIQQAPCPLRAINVVGLFANPHDNNKREVELLVGSNNKTISLLRFSQRHDKYFTAFVQREWVNAHKGSVYTIDYDNKRKVFVSGSNDKSLRLGRVDSPTLSQPMKGHTGTIRCVKFAPALDPFNAAATSNGNGLDLVASGGAGDNRVRLWDINTGTNHSTLSAHSGTVHGMEWLDGVTLLSGDEKGQVLAHDLRKLHLYWTCAKVTIFDRIEQH